MDTKVSVEFLGGVADGANLTGSCLLLEISSGKKINRFLLDAGMIQCRFRESLERNLQLVEKIESSSIDGIILTHSHIDHCGRIPLLVKNGFNGKIYCTKQSARLLPIMLEDNAGIQLNEAMYRKKKMTERRKEKKSSSRCWLGKYDHRRRKAKQEKNPNLLNQPLYNLEDVRQTCQLIKIGGLEYEEWLRLAKDVELKFYPSGHVLGGAIVVVRIKRKDTFLHLGFSGDLGREDGVILPPPKNVEEKLDHWFSESTYGGKIHPAREEEISRLMEIVSRASEKNGKIIIPSFALERTQEIIYILSRLMASGDIRKMPIFLDSPMAEKITEVFSSCWNSPGLFKGQESLSFNPFCPQQNRILHLIKDQLESAKLSEAKGPHIIIAGSGMCDAGRVRGHLRKGLPKSETIVCLVGYMTEGSLGWKLKEHYPLVKMNGVEIPVNAKVEVFESFSAHADSLFLSAYAEKIAKNGNGSLKSIILLHGESKSALDLKVKLIEKLAMGREQIATPKVGDVLFL